MKRATDSMDDSMIPIARPRVGDPEIENVVHVLRSGMLAGGRFGRAALDYVTGAGGDVTDSQSGFRALNRNAVAVGLLVGTLKKDDFSIAVMTRIYEWQRCRSGAGTGILTHQQRIRFLMVGALGLFMGLMLNVISRLRVEEGDRG